MQSIGHDLRRGLNNINPLGNNYKHINKWLAELKNVDSSLKTLDKELSAEAKFIAAWGANEGDDLADVCQRMTQLMEEVGLIHQAYSIRHTDFRKTIKSIKNQEMTLDEMRKTKHDLTTQIAKLQKSNKDKGPVKLMELQTLLEKVTSELLVAELDLMQFKRVTIKDAFNAKFEAMLEYSEKMALIAGYGRQITHVIDTEAQVADRMRIYQGAEYTAAAVNQAKAAVTSWQATPADAPVRTHIASSQDELALSAAAAAYNNHTPTSRHNLASVNSAVWEDAQLHAIGSTTQPPAKIPVEHNHWENDRNEGAGVSEAGSTPYSQGQQTTLLQEQQRQLELEQQRLYQQNMASYSPGPSRSPLQQHYQNAAGGGFTPSAPRRSDTQEMYPPAPGYDYGESGPSPGYNGYANLHSFGQYDNSTYNMSPAPVRPYHLGFVDPQERSRMENADMYKAEVRGGRQEPPRILDEK